MRLPFGSVRKSPQNRALWVGVRNRGTLSRPCKTSTFRADPNATHVSKSRMGKYPIATPIVKYSWLGFKTRTSMEISELAEPIHNISGRVLFSEQPGDSFTLSRQLIPLGPALQSYLDSSSRLVAGRRPTREATQLKSSGRISPKKYRDPSGYEKYDRGNRSSDRVLKPCC
jgi:hypothetical protein